MAATTVQAWHFPLAPRAFSSSCLTGAAAAPPRLQPTPAIPTPHVRDPCPMPSPQPLGWACVASFLTPHTPCGNDLLLLSSSPPLAWPVPRLRHLGCSPTFLPPRRLANRCNLLSPSPALRFFICFWGQSCLICDFCFVSPP